MKIKKKIFRLFYYCQYQYNSPNVTKTLQQVKFSRNDNLIYLSFWNTHVVNVVPISPVLFPI